MGFKQSIKSVDIEDDGETKTFYIRKASHGEMLAFADENKGKDRSPSWHSKYLFSKFLVHEDGSAFTKEEVINLDNLESAAGQELIVAINESLQPRTKEKKG